MNVIMDRTSADVEAVATAKAKFEVVDSVGSYIQIQDLGSGKYLVFKGTQSELDAYNAGLKGAWNYTDLNRIGNNLRELESAFEAVGTSVSFVAKNDWALGDIPETSDAEDIINDIASAKSAGSVTGDSVETLDGLTYVTANRIEEIIYLSFLKSQSINGYFNHCGTSFCGAEGVLA